MSECPGPIFPNRCAFAPRVSVLMRTSEIPNAGVPPCLKNQRRHRDKCPLPRITANLQCGFCVHVITAKCHCYSGMSQGGLVKGGAKNRGFFNRDSSLCDRSSQVHSASFLNQGLQIHKLTNYFQAKTSKICLYLVLKVVTRF
jgi:hypothetical protein